MPKKRNSSVTILNILKQLKYDEFSIDNDLNFSFEIDKN